MSKKAHLSTGSFRDAPLAELCLEDALEAGAAKSAKVSSDDFKETSIKFCVDGLYKWCKSFAQRTGRGSVYSLTRDLSWYWASYCTEDNVLSGLVKEYYSLLHDITEDTSYTDLAERMDEASRIEKVGRYSEVPFHVKLPLEPCGIIGDCATAVGISFSLFFQVGLGKALSVNRGGLYADWVARKFQPLFSEVMARAEGRLYDFLEIRNTVDFRRRQGR